MSGYAYATCAACVLPWKKYVSGSVHKYSGDADAVLSSTAEQCKRLMKQRVTANILIWLLMI